MLWKSVTRFLRWPPLLLWSTSMSFYYINSIFLSPDLFITIYDILNNDIFTCSCWASLENWLLWRYASQSSLLYGGFRHTTELPLQPYQIQLYTCTFWGARVSNFFYLGSPTNTHQPCADGFGSYTLLSEGLYGCSELNILTSFLPMGRGFQTKSKSKTCTCWLNGCYIYTLQRFTPHKNEKRNICRKNTEFYELIELPS